MKPFNKLAINSSNAYTMSNIDVSGAILKFLGVLFVLTLPIHPVLLATLALVITDMITGVWAALKKGSRITSFMLRRTPSKLLGYWLGILAGFGIEFLVEGVPAVKTIAAVVALTEGKSIFENLHVITGVDLWKTVLDKVHGTNINPPDEPKK